MGKANYRADISLKGDVEGLAVRLPRKTAKTGNITLPVGRAMLRRSQVLIKLIRREEINEISCAINY